MTMCVREELEMTAEGAGLSREFRYLVIICLTMFTLATLERAKGTETGTSSDKTRSTFNANCAGCHGTDGTATALGKRLLAPDLSSKEVQAQSSAILARTISGGKNNMPPFGDRLDSEQIQKLVGYVHRLGAKAAASTK
jgi:mono/diheme cytochrome c family protein